MLMYIHVDHTVEIACLLGMDDNNLAKDELGQNL